MLNKPDLNKPAFKVMPMAKALVAMGKCPMCHEDIDENEFKNELSKKEYTISGLCETCQDELFTED